LPRRRYAHYARRRGVGLWPAAPRNSTPSVAFRPSLPRSFSNFFSNHVLPNPFPSHHLHQHPALKFSATLAPPEAISPGTPHRRSARVSDPDHLSRLATIASDHYNCIDAPTRPSIPIKIRIFRESPAAEESCSTDRLPRPRRWQRLCRNLRIPPLSHQQPFANC